MARIFVNNNLSGYGIRWTGDWNSETNYLIGDIVNYNGNTYISNELSLNELPTNVNFWDLGGIGEKGDDGADSIVPGPAGESLNWTGVYSNAINYLVNDAVEYNGSSYVCILPSVGILPTNTTYFGVVAKRGEDGIGSGDMLKLDYDTDDSGVVDNAERVNNLTVETAVPAGALFTDTDTDTTYTDAEIKAKYEANADTNAFTDAEKIDVASNKTHSSTISGNPHSVTKTEIGLSNVDNTSDLNKPISTATQTALNSKENIANKSTNITTDTGSDTKYPSVKAVETYVTENAGGGASTQSSIIAGEDLSAGDALRNGTVGAYSENRSQLIDTIGIGLDTTVKDIDTFTTLNTGTVIKSMEIKGNTNGTTITAYGYITDLSNNVIAQTAGVTFTYNSNIREVKVLTFSTVPTLTANTQYKIRVSATSSMAISAENTTGYPIYYNMDILSIEDETKIFKTDASNENAINFIGFANETAVSGTSVNINTAGVDGSQTLLTLGDEYYLSDKYEGKTNPITGTISQLSGAYSSTYVANVGYGFGQSFSTTDEGQVSSVEFYFPSVQSSYTANAEVRLYTANGDLPDILIGTTAEELINAEGLKVFTFASPIDIIHGDKYIAVVVFNSGSRLYTPWVTSSSLYSGGVAINNTANSWYTRTYDLYFKINTTKYTYTNISGAISTIPGTNSVIVGKAISSTELEIYTGGKIGATSALGIRETLLNNVTYTALSDGIVTVFGGMITTTGAYVRGYIDGVLVMQTNPWYRYVGSYETYGSFSYPVKNGETYKVSTDGTIMYARFIPLT